MTFSTEQLRSLLFQYFREASANNSKFRPEYGKCCYGVDQLYAKNNGREIDFNSGTRFLNDDDKRRLLHVIWDLILQRVLIPGIDDPDSHYGWPHLTITDHGKKVIQEANPVPYDPDGYLRHVKKFSPNLHPTAFRYLEEALATFRMGTYLASAVMLGASSEKVFQHLAASIVDAHSDPLKKKKFESLAVNGKMKKRIDTVADWCRQNREYLPGQWKGTENVEVLYQLGHFIRKRRNDAGHPQDPPAIPSHEEMYAWLVVFPNFVNSLYELRDFLSGKFASK